MGFELRKKGKFEEVNKFVERMQDNLSRQILVNTNSCISS